ncbi:MAG: GDYXXLXY domain-containing protein [Rhizobiaceae bacterium]|nr:GDYXXLXY domain-containing protein [Rhizobiaceae bacterium]
MHARYLLPIAVVVALAQIGVLASMIMDRAAILRDGREVVLEVLPVDPRDLLRGDYVRLTYNISSIPAEMFAGADSAESGIVYVRLKPGEGGIWQPIAARFGQPLAAAPAPDEVDIRGTTYTRDLENVRIVGVDYGIERFYVPEGEGRPIEENLRERTFRMAVAVGQDGTAQIKAFFDGETLIYREPLY